jgi:VWFA-related protein
MREERNAGRRRLGIVAAIAVILLSCVTDARAQQSDEESAVPFDTDFVERSGVTLMLLDVEVFDKQGNPVPGLRREDFGIQLNGRERPIYSLDDLCRPASAAPGRTPEPESVADESGVALPPTFESDQLAPPPAIAPAKEIRFILYMDYSQLAPFGRANAVETARRWVRETMRSGDLVQIAAYATLPGLKRLTPFTSDKDSLLAALEAADAEPLMVDPFPGFLGVRMEECASCCRRAAKLGCNCDDPDERCCPICFYNARDDYFHGKHSLEALNRYLRSLESVPGRKELLLFHENGTLFPARFYPQGEAPELRVGEQLSLADKSGAEANLSRTKIHTLFSGLAETGGTFVNLGANLADFTGGTYSRGSVNLSRVADAAGRGPSCIYRIGLQRPTDWRDGISRAKVWVRDRALPYRYRVQFLDEVDRWWRRARAVLADPDNYSTIDVGAVVLPLSVSDKGWNLLVQVAVDARSLMLFPTAGRQQGDWEVGALLTRDRGEKNWEMLGRSRLSHTGSELPGDFVVHEHRFSGLKPGTYRLGAFVRDRTANEFGGARATLVLPPPRRDSLAGPIPLAVDRSRIISSLPLLKGGAGDDSRSGDVGTGSVPLDDSGVPIGQPLEFGTWICPAHDAPSVARLLRFVSAGGEPLFRMPSGRLQPEGDCYLVTDRIDTLILDEGDYTYHFRWNRDGSEPIEEQVEFSMVAGAAIDPSAEETEVSSNDGGEGSEGLDEDDSATGTLTATAAAAAGLETLADAPVDEPRDPAMLRLQEQILARLANVSLLYRDNALRFTCDETILSGGRGSPVLHKFRYLYRYSESEQMLQDFRLPRRGLDPDELSDAGQVQLDTYGLPVFLLRAYSWIFIFHEDNQPLYRYDLRGEDEALHRPAWRIDFEPIPPIRSSYNDWFGSAWIDRETYQLLLVEARRPDDHEREALLQSMLQTVRESGRGGYAGTIPILSYTTEFDVEKNGMRFPGRSLIDKVDFEIRGGKVVERPVFHVSQTYKRYRFYNVRTAEEIRAIVDSP